MLRKEFTDDFGGGSNGRAIANKRIERFRKMKANDAAADDQDNDYDSMEPDSQESLIESSILECKEYIGNLDGIHNQQKELLGSTLHDASIIGKL